jgi:integrase/recombinase XerD
MKNSQVGRPEGTTGKARVLSDKELKQVIRVAEAGVHPERNVAVLVMSNYLGLRAKELAALKVSDVVYDNGELKTVLRLVASMTKGNKHRDLPLENKAVIKAITDYLKTRTDGNRALFLSQKGSHFTPNTMARLLIKLYENAGFNDASSHTGRRSLITKLAYAGTDLNSIRQIAGHTSIATTQIYINDNPMVIATILKSI